MTKQSIVSAMFVSGLAFFVFTVPSAHAEEPKPTPSQTDAPTSSPDKPTEEEQPTKYVVQSGDYLSKIAGEHEISWPSIYEVNQIIGNPDIIYSGTELTIPAHDVPLTRLVPQESTLAIPNSYQPQAASKPTSTATKPAPAAAPATAKAAVGGVPGLSSVLGRPYVAGGNSPATGFDCSGLTQYLAAQKGVSVPRTASGQYQALRHISIAEAVAGDIIIFNLGHAGTYLGGGQVVHALNPKQGIRVENLQTAIKYNGFLSAVAVGH